MAVMTGLSGNEIYCLQLKGLQPGNLVIGNSVYSIGFIGSLGSGMRTMVGGEVSQITSLIHDGRRQSFARMMDEAKRHGGAGITGVSNELVQHAGNIEFLSIGSAVHQAGMKSEELSFTSSADGQELYCQIDAGFQPLRFVFGNVAYAIGVAGGLMGALKSMARGEVEEYSQIFSQTRHLALQRITAEACAAGANAVVGINTSIIGIAGVQEMLMIGTASRHAQLPAQYATNPITSDLTNEEMWNLINIGYMPLQLVMGVSVYSVGVMGGLKSAFQAFVRGEISDLTTLIYSARENALAHIARDAQSCGADDVVGIKTYVYNLGSGMIEFLAIGTAVKKMNGLTTQTPTLPAQAIIRDKDTYINTVEMAMDNSLNKPNE